MEGFPPTPLVPTGWVNATTPYFFTQPQVTHILTSPTSVYVATNGSDAPDNVGSITSPFLTIQAAIDYITNQPPYLAYPQTTVCIFVSPGEYPGNIQLEDNIYIVGATPANNSQVSSKLGPVTIVSGSLTIINNESSDSICRIDNIAFSGSLGVRITPAFYTSSLELSNCTFVTSNALSALAFDQLTLSAAAYVTAKNCTFKSTSPLTNAVISSAVSDLSFLTLEECTIISPSVNGSLINMLGSLTLRDCVLRNIAPNQASLGPLIKVVSGANQTPQVDITGCVLEYIDVSTVDVSGTKLAVLYDAPLNPITSRITNNTISIFLGAAQTDIVKNIGGGQVTLSQSANSCLLDGKTIDTTNLVLTAAFFLQDSPLPPPPAGGVSYLNSLEGSITLSGGDGITVGSVGSTITLTNSGALSVAGVTGAITLTGTNVSIGVVSNNINLGVTFPAIPVTSVGTKIGAVTFAAGLEGGLALAYGANNAAPITISNTGVITIEAIAGDVTLSTTTTGLTIVPTGQDIAINVTFPVTTVGAKTGNITFATGAQGGLALAYGANNAAPITISNTGMLSVVAGTGITLTGDTPQNPTINVNLPVYQATYYKTANQNLTNGSTDITFDALAAWNNINGYITHVSGSTDFTVVQTGLYQLEWNASVTANGATWSAYSNKVISVDITRSPAAEQVVLSQTASCATTTNYTQSLCVTFYLVAGDVFNCRIQGSYATGTPFAAAVTSTYDLNTWFSWRYISS